MVNFGYGPGMKGWNDSKKWMLANRLNDMLFTMRREEKIKSKWCIVPMNMDGSQPLIDGEAPYIEVDGLYQGVRIRKITHLTEEQQDNLIIEAEKVYHEVMMLQ